MGKLVSLEDIEEFQQIYRIPRNAINDKILKGIRQLDEKKEIEPFLREIITDITETPHNPSEIVDIFTTHIHYSSQQNLAAFIIKGKSFPKVTSKLVGNQYFKLRQIPRLDIAFLVAVGNILDDAKRDFLITCEDMDADFVIIDAIDMARLFIIYNKICPKDGNNFATGICKICGTSASDPIELTLKVNEELHYEIFGPEDISHAGAKRYKAEVLTSPHYSKAALRKVIKKVNWELHESNFYRSKLTEQRYGTQNADCIFLFIYLSMTDKQQTNWICHTQWVRPDLQDNFKPYPIEGEDLSFNGDETLGEIKIEWNKTYHTWKAFSSTRRGKKEDWIQKIETLLPQIYQVLLQLANYLSDYENNQIDEIILQQELGKLEVAAMELSMASGNKNYPPLDCEKCDLAFINLVGNLHNILLPFATWGKANYTFPQKLHAMYQYINWHEERKQEFLYHWRKIRS